MGTKENLFKGKSPFRAELNLCLIELCEEGDDMVDPSADWTMQFSRGGLYLI